MERPKQTKISMLSINNKFEQQIKAMDNVNGHRRKRALSSVEDSKEYNIILQDIAREAGEEAIMEARVLKIPVTYLNDNHQVVKRTPDGRIEVIEQIFRSKAAKILRKGTILHARKG